MSLLAELKRRNVIRMAGLYLVGAWLTVQVAETLLPIFGTPGWVLKTLVVLLALGFVPALVFSWVFELTSTGLKRDGEVASSESIAPQTARRMDRLFFAGLLALIVVIAADRWWPRAAAERAEKGSESFSDVPGSANAESVASENDSDSFSATTNSPIAPNSIAVLPFVNMSADKDNEYFSDGISEELLNVLVRVEGLQVASRTSSFAFKGGELGSRAIAEQLKVAHLLEGSVRKSGNQVRITAQLIDAANDRHLWSETFDRELTDIFVIQDEIAKAIVGALRGALKVADGDSPAVEVKADTDNLPAYETYLKARELFIARRDMQEGVRLFERVVELDPKFARGWEGLAGIYSVAESWGIRDRDYTELARTAARRALELDAKLSMPWAALGMAEMNNAPINWETGLAHFDRAIAADANNATAWLFRSIAWLNLGFFERAHADQDRCLAIDPAYRNCVRWKSLTHLHAGQIEQALALFERGVAEGFTTNRAFEFVPLLHARGDRIGARLLLHEMGANTAAQTAIMARLDDPQTPGDDANELARRFFMEGDSEWIAGVDDATGYLFFGAFDRVADADQLSFDTGVTWLSLPAEWRNSPGFKKLVTRVGLADYWRKHGYPPQCRPLGKSDFECVPPAPVP